jgi:hypothetical protein
MFRHLVAQINVQNVEDQDFSRMTSALAGTLYFLEHLVPAVGSLFAVCSSRDIIDPRYTTGIAKSAKIDHPSFNVIAWPQSRPVRAIKAR